MHNPAEAYGRTANMTVSDPREFEGSLLIKAASKLQTAKDTCAKLDPTLTEALLYNRKLWSIFATSVVEHDDGLPKEIRENIANLSIFVFKQTSAITSQPTPGKLDTLININRQIAAGLFARPKPSDASKN